MIKNFFYFKEIKPLRNFTYKTSGKFNWPCHEWSLISRWCLFCLNSFHCAFVHKEVRCTNKTEIKDGLQYTNKKLSLLGYNNILYTWGFNNELETVHFLNYCLLETLSSWRLSFFTVWKISVKHLALHFRPCISISQY